MHVFHMLRLGINRSDLHFCVLDEYLIFAENFSHKTTIFLAKKTSTLLSFVKLLCLISYSTTHMLIVSRYYAVTTAYNMSTLHLYVQSMYISHICIFMYVRNNKGVKFSYYFFIRHTFYLFSFSLALGLKESKE